MATTKVIYTERLLYWIYQLSNDNLMESGCLVKEIEGEFPSKGTVIKEPMVVMCDKGQWLPGFSEEIFNKTIGAGRNYDCDYIGKVVQQVIKSCT